MTFMKVDPSDAERKWNSSISLLKYADKFIFFSSVLKKYTF